MLDSLVNYIRFSERIRMNQVTYYISRIPVIKYLIPENPYAPETKKKLIYTFATLSLLLGIFFNNLTLGFIYFGISTFINIGDYGRNLAPLWIIYATFVLSMIKSLNMPSYATGKPNNYRSLLYHFRLDAKDISRNMRIDYFARGILNRIYLFILMPNLYYTALAFGAWYAGILMVDAFHAYYFKKHEKIFLDQSNFNMKNGMIRAAFYMLMVFAAFVPVIIPVLTQENIDVSPIFMSVGVLVLMALATFFDYKSTQNFDYKLMLRAYIAGFAGNLDTSDVAKMTKDKNAAHVSKDFDKNYKGEGFVMLNNIFFRRYSKLWRKRSLINFGVIAVFTLSVVVMVFMDTFYGFDFKPNLTGLYGLILLGLYYLNFGETITQALFYNCDSSLLGYRMYNTSEKVLPNFIQRLKHVVRLHLPQTIVLGFGVMLLTKAIEPDSTIIMLGLVFVAFMFASILFCTHSLVIYYLFQPYTINLEMKGIGYSIMNTITYVIVYVLADIGIESMNLLKIIIGSSIVYFPIAALLVYYLAPVRFKVKR